MTGVADICLFGKAVTINEYQMFVMNFDRPNSLDGRYFGPLPITSIIGQGTPLWTPGEQD